MQVVIHQKNISSQKMLLALGCAPIYSSALGAAFVRILLSEVEREPRPSMKGDREAIVV